MMTKQKNIGIEALRFIFMLFICIWHYRSYYIIQHGYLGVEFFFILSGYLLYKSSSKKIKSDPVDYTWKKIKRFAPKYLVALMISFIILSLIPHLKEGDYTQLTYDLLRLIPESMMLQQVGFYQGGINFPLWFLCVLIVGGGLIYTWLYVNKKITIGVILPLLIVLGYTFLFNIDGGTKIEHWGVYGIISLPLLRGILDMGVGVVLGYIMDSQANKIKQSVKVFNWLWVISFLFVIVLHFISFNIDQYALIFFSLLIMGTMIEGSVVEKIFKGKIWIKLGSITFSMLVLHASIIRIYSDYIHPKIGSGILNLILYILFLIVASFLFDYLFEKKSIDKKKNSVTNSKS